jgi:hypothetical protein
MIGEVMFIAASLTVAWRAVWNEIAAIITDWSRWRRLWFKVPAPCCQGAAWPL